MQLIKQASKHYKILNHVSVQFGFRFSFLPFLPGDYRRLGDTDLKETNNSSSKEFQELGPVHHATCQQCTTHIRKTNYLVETGLHLYAPPPHVYFTLEKSRI